jgi:hypothetical protein
MHEINLETWKGMSEIKLRHEAFVKYTGGDPKQFIELGERSELIRKSFDIYWQGFREGYKLAFKETNDD